MDNTANCIKDAQLVLQQAFQIQKGYHDRQHRPLLAYTAENSDTVSLKSHLIAALPTYQLGPQRSPPFKILPTPSGCRPVELDFPLH